MEPPYYLFFHLTSIIFSRWHVNVLRTPVSVAYSLGHATLDGCWGPAQLCGSLSKQWFLRCKLSFRGDAEAGVGRVLDSPNSYFPLLYLLDFWVSFPLIRVFWGGEGGVNWKTIMHRRRHWKITLGTQWKTSAGAEELGAGLWPQPDHVALRSAVKGSSVAIVRVFSTLSHLKVTGWAFKRPISETPS